MEKPKRTVFYSWQSDLDGKTTRSFIEEALKRAVKAIKNDDSIQVEPVLAACRRESNWQRRTASLLFCANPCILSEEPAEAGLSFVIIRRTKDV